MEYQRISENLSGGSLWKGNFIHEKDDEIPLVMDGFGGHDVGEEHSTDILWKSFLNSKWTHLKTNS